MGSVQWVPKCCKVGRRADCSWPQSMPFTTSTSFEVRAKDHGLAGLVDNLPLGLFQLQKKMSRSNQHFYSSCQLRSVGRSEHQSISPSNSTAYDTGTSASLSKSTGLSLRHFFSFTLNLIPTCSPLVFSHRMLAFLCGFAVSLVLSALCFPFEVDAV